MKNIDLSGKRVLVTGSARGIGATIARSMAECGASVALNSVHSKEACEALAQEICRDGGQAIAVMADVSDFEDAARLVQTVQDELGGLDILVNNAGITRDNLLLRMTETAWDEVIATNLKGVFNCTRAAVKSMVKQRSGVVINIASVVGLSGNAGQANYAAAKAGIIGFSKSAAKELGSRNIRVNVIAPGFIKTDMTDGLTEQAKEQILSQITLNRFGSTDDIADATLFLASDLSSYMTGQVIVVDGLLRG